MHLHVRVNDTQAPVITCPANITVNSAPGVCTSNVTFSVTATDKLRGDQRGERAAQRLCFPARYDNGGPARRGTAAATAANAPLR